LSSGSVGLAVSAGFGVSGFLAGSAGGVVTLLDVVPAALAVPVLARSVVSAGFGFGGMVLRCSK